MDIHKPKPIHNWREFLKEVGIIVLGVSIALAAEQGVERWHQGQQYREAREAMRTELSYDRYNISRRDLFAACTRRRMDEIATLLDRAQKGKPFETPRWIGPASAFRLRFSAEAEAGKSGLFAPGEQRNFSMAYGWLHTIDVEQDRERIAWGRLQMLEGMSSLPPELINSLRLALADARFSYDRIPFIMGWLNMTAREFGLGGNFSHDSVLTNIPKTWPHCLPMNTPRDEALRLTAWYPPEFQPPGTN
jgi:hypothetical protein